MEVVIAVTRVIAGGMSTRIAARTGAAAAAAGAFAVVTGHGDVVSRIIVLMMARVLARGTILALVARVLAALGPGVLTRGMQFAILPVRAEELGLAFIASVAIVSTVIAAIVARVISVVSTTTMVIAPMATAAIASAIRLAVGALIATTITA